MAKDVVNLVLRLPKSLHSRLKQDAVRSGNSLNSEIISQIELSAQELERIIADAKRKEAEFKRKEAEFKRLRAAWDRLPRAPAPDQINEIVKASLERALAGLAGSLFVRPTTENGGPVWTIRRTNTGKPPFWEVVTLEQEQKEREELARQVRHLPDVARDSASAKDQPAQSISQARRSNDPVAPSPSRSGAACSEVKTKTPA